MKTHFHVIYLAAGYSRRFFGNKLLAPLNGKSLYRHTLDRLLEIRREAHGAVDITVVTQYEAIREAMDALGVRCVLNPDPSRGQASSIIEGILALKGQSADNDYLVFFTGDQPFLKKETIAAYLRAVDETQPLLAAFFLDGRCRNPGAFRMSLKEEFLTLRGETGGREILQRHAKEVMPFTAFESRELQDIDVRADLTSVQGGSVYG